MNWLLVFIGGGLGSVTRFGITKMTMKYSADILFPAGTFIVNILATILLLLFVNFYKIQSKESLYFFLVTGFCGGFSTFSAFSYETASLLQTGHYTIATLNILLSVIACVGIAFLMMRSA